MQAVLVSILMLCLCLNLPANAEEEELVYENNEYGGMTKQVIYSEGDPNYRKGLHKIIVSYDGKGVEKRLEVFATESQTEKLGWHKKIIYHWGESKMSFRIQSEAAIRVWQILWEYRDLRK